MTKKAKRLLWSLLAFVVVLLGLQIVFQVTEYNREKVTYNVFCINQLGDTVAIYETQNIVRVDSHQKDDINWAKINYFLTTNGEHVSVATKDGKILIEKKK